MELNVSSWKCHEFGLVSMRMNVFVEQRREGKKGSLYRILECVLQSFFTGHSSPHYDALCDVFLVFCVVVSTLFLLLMQENRRSILEDIFKTTQYFLLCHFKVRRQPPFNVSSIVSSRSFPQFSQ